MIPNADRVYSFIFRGLLADEALNRAGRVSQNFSNLADLEIAKSVALDVLDDELVSAAKKMAIVYASIAAFENSVRKLISRRLLEEAGDNWWDECVSESIRKRAASRMKEEEKVKWHTQRGGDPINYTTLTDLGNIIRNNWGKFEPFVHSAEWAASVFDVVERSRNVIMHSGMLDREDMERVGINIRDWTKQVGA